MLNYDWSVMALEIDMEKLVEGLHGCLSDFASI